MTTPAIEVSGLAHRFGATEALRGVSFTVHSGEVFGLLGPNGAGKTTTIQVLLTLLRPQAGTARVAGVDVAANPDAVRRRAGWVPQERAVDPLLTARENLIFAGGLYHLPARLARARASELLALVGLESEADRLVRGFSGGMRRRLELAMGLVHQPSVLFLDEPTLGLDVAARITVWEHIEQVRRSGMTVLLTTHYLDEADSLCDRVAIIDSGRIIAVGTPMELKRAYGQDTLCVELTEPVTALAPRVADHPKVAAVRADGYTLEADVTDLVAVTRFVLDECGRLGLAAQDLWGRRASLDQVFLGLTGRAFSQADE
ncbi:MAG TPA: ATP-binding cassette domain-containing protein [Natronosporangium sp.]